MSQSRERMLRLLVESRVYLVTEDAVPSERRIAAAAEALAAGARVLQLRDKSTSKRLLLDEARTMKALCAEWNALFLVNDDLALAWCADADGVHLGQTDLPPEEARRLLGPEKLIGLSISAVDELSEAEKAGVDYLGVGAIFATPTKVDAELGGMDLLRRVRSATTKPLVAIGGIDAGNCGAVLQAGADSVAVVRAVFAQPNVANATRELLRISHEAKAATRGN